MATTPTKLTALNVTENYQVNGTDVVDANQTLTNKTLDGDHNYFMNMPLVYAGTVTRAQMVSGLALIPAVSGKTIRILGYELFVTGAFNAASGGTSFILQDTNSTPVVITTAAKAALTDGARISSYGLAIANVTDGVGLTGNLTPSKGVSVKADAAWDGGTSIKVVILYMYIG